MIAMHQQNRLRHSVLVIIALCLGGCSNTLETGYVPRALGASSTERRGYYASPFTPEAAAAQQYKTSDPNLDTRSNHRPGGYR
jgi:hypothetical protein